MASLTNLLALNNAGFFTSREADDLNTKLMSRLGLKNRYEPARLAIARSLSVPNDPPAMPEGGEGDGKTIHGHTLFGDDLAVWVSLIVERSSLEDATTADIRDLVKRHWHRGVQLLFEEWTQCGDDFDKYIMQLASRAGVKEGSGGGIDDLLVGGDAFRPKAVPISLTIGDVSAEVGTQQHVSWRMNGRGNPPHIALMGAAGSGKTTTGMHLVRQIRKQSGAPVLIFDMAKGDIARDADLIRDLKAEVLVAPRVSIPLDVLHIADKSTTEVTNAAMRFRESFARVTSSRPGGHQLDALREGAKRALMNKGQVTLVDVRDHVREVYTEKKKKDDTVMSTFNDLTSWELFQPKMTPAEFFSKSWIVDVHEAPETAQKLIVFLLLDALYAHHKMLPDSDMDGDGHRAIRLTVAIDEARKVLGYEHESLISIIRETRSKGCTVLLMSQSPDDYDSEDENFLENIGLAVCFKTNASASALNKVLGQSVDLAGLPSGVCVTRLPDRHGVVRVKAWEWKQ